MPDGRGSSSGPLVAQRQGRPGHGRLLSRTSSRSASSAPTTRKTGKQLWRFHTIATRRRTRRRYVGQPDESVPRRRRDLDHRQLRSGSQSHLLGHGAGQAVDAGQPRACTRSTRRSTRAPPSRSISIPASWRGTTRTRPAKRSTSTSCSSACSSTPAGQNLVFTVGKDGVLWKLDRKTGKYLGHKETVFQNVWEKFDPQTGDADVSRRHHRPRGRPVGRRLPEHRGRPQLAGDEPQPRDESADHSAQPELHRDSRAEDRAEGRRRQRRRRRSPLLRDAGHRRQHRQARRVRREHA